MGATSQGKAVEFTVQDNAVTSVSFGYHVVGVLCTAENDLTLAVKPPRPIVGAAFSVPISVGGGATGLSATFRGSFVSDGAASGDISLLYTQVQPFPPCQVAIDPVWNALKSIGAALPDASPLEEGPR